MMTDEKHYRWDEGLPTKPDVDVLMRNWPDPKIGDRFEYVIIEKLLSLSRKNVRFRTITARWRDRLQDEKGVVVLVDQGEAFYVATADQVASVTPKTLRHVGRQARDQRKRLATVKIENELQRMTIEHQGRLMLAVEKDAKKHRMNLIPSTAAKELPQIGPPKERKGGDA